MREDNLEKTIHSLGRSLLIAYRNRWIPLKCDMDSFINTLVTQKAWYQEDPVVGGPEKIPQQELAIRIKENNDRYQALITKIDRMERILTRFNDDQMFIIEQYHWNGTPWFEIAEVLELSRSTLFDRLKVIEKTTAYLWEGQVVKVGIIPGPKVCYNGNIGVNT